MSDGAPAGPQQATEWIEVRVRGLHQLFNSIDPSPFHDRDLDPNADDFIESWARQISGGVALALRVNVEEPPRPDDTAVVRQAIQQFYARKAEGARRLLRDLFRRGRTSLAIAIVFLTILSFAANTIAVSFESPLSEVVREGLLIGGWVAMWRPLEIFLYDWWPIRARARLFDRLAAMPVEIRFLPRASGGPPPAP